MGTIYPFFGTFGTTSTGLLRSAEAIPSNGAHFKLYHAPQKAYAVPSLVHALARSADKVADVYDGAVLRIGDSSAAHGGQLAGHSSHRSGRDVDLAFYTADIYGHPIDGIPLVHFDRFGVGTRGGTPVRFDTPRNWALVQALLTDEEIEVQWIFVSAGLKALLLEWALEHETDLNMVERAASILRQPGDSAPHDDHFHVRIFCPKDAFGTYCVDTKPFWPWHDLKPVPPSPSDEVLLKAALEGLE
jgi:penicillin-insensitive murein endopeptidase